MHPFQRENNSKEKEKMRHKMKVQLKQNERRTSGYNLQNGDEEIEKIRIPKTVRDRIKRQLQMASCY